MTLGKTKFVIRGILFIILLVLFYILFMKSALEKFIDGATTIVQSQEKGVQPNLPVLVICPDPPFKPSYFKKLDLVNSGHEKYFWDFYRQYISKLEYSTPADIYMNMSRMLGEEWNIRVFGKDFIESIILKTGRNDHSGKEIYVQEI